MPLFKTIQVDKTTQILVWKITESLEDLTTGIVLTSTNKTRFESMKSEIHQKGFLSVRQLLKEVNYKDSDVLYDTFGKPSLKNGKYISITHSFTFVAIIISDKNPVGIDIEKQRDKIVKIAPKFTAIHEYKSIVNHNALVRKLTIVWGAKESLYKIYGKKKLLFLHHIYVDDFALDTQKTTGEIRFEGTSISYQIAFLEFEGFTCVYAY